MNYSVKEKFLILLDSLKEVTYNQKKELATVALSLEDTPDFQEFCANLIKFVADGLYNILKGKCTLKNIDVLLSIYSDRDIVPVCYFSSEYPDFFHETNNPPLILYTQGNRELLKKRKIAVVGSRKLCASAIGKTQYFAENLSSSLVVIGGVADGADEIVADSAKEENLILFLPCGIDKVNEGRRRKIASVQKKGLVITEYPPQTPIYKFSYARRNSLLTDMADEILAVGAGEDSNIIPLCQRAISIGKKVYAFPYDMDNVTGKGCNRLIKEGAFLCDDLSDILGKTSQSVQEDISDLEEDEKAIYEYLKDNGAVETTLMCMQLNMQTYELIPILSMLEIKGYIQPIDGTKKYRTVR